MCVIVSAHVCLFACECIGVCGSYFINVFLSHLVVEKEGDVSECVCVCVSVCLLFRKHHVFCSECMQMMCTHSHLKTEIASMSFCGVRGGKKKKRGGEMCVFSNSPPPPPPCPLQ